MASNSMILNAIKPFMPQIQEKAVPAIESAILAALDTIPEDENRKAILVVTNDQNKPFVLKVTFDKDDKIIQTHGQYPVEELVKTMLTNLKF